MTFTDVLGTFKIDEFYAPSTHSSGEARSEQSPRPEPTSFTQPDWTLGVFVTPSCQWPCRRAGPGRGNPRMQNNGRCTGNAPVASSTLARAQGRYPVSKSTKTTSRRQKTPSQRRRRSNGRSWGTDSATQSQFWQPSLCRCAGVCDSDKASSPPDAVAAQCALRLPRDSLVLTHQALTSALRVELGPKT
eukprot:3211442-Rhodomonas_salina.2